MLTLSQEKSNYKVEEVEMTDMIFGKGEDEDAGKVIQTRKLLVLSRKLAGSFRDNIQSFHVCI